MRALTTAGLICMVFLMGSGVVVYFRNRRAVMLKKRKRQ